ncbi:MAG: helix-turn-helix transcriptional regulator [Clostridia bacterium]|nr:helix-turn-helix transcriptional regulator [Clostridia bacterium]
MTTIGEKIKSLRKSRGISQEVLGEYLGVSYQAVSKWENGNTLPDVTMIPALAFFFGVSTDELFDYNVYEVEKEVEKICHQSWEYRDSNPQKAEKILRDGLKRFPGNDVLINNLLYTMDYTARSTEVIELCKMLIETTKEDDVKYDALRILATCYHENGQQNLVESTLDNIPEIYFSKNELMAKLTAGESSFENARIEKINSANDLVEMLVIIGNYLVAQGEIEIGNNQLHVAKKIVNAFCDDKLSDELHLSFEKIINK